MDHPAVPRNASTSPRGDGQSSQSPHVAQTYAPKDPARVLSGGQMGPESGLDPTWPTGRLWVSREEQRSRSGSSGKTYANKKGMK